MDQTKYACTLHSTIPLAPSVAPTLPRHVATVTPTPATAAAAHTALQTSNCHPPPEIYTTVIKLRGIFQRLITHR